MRIQTTEYKQSLKQSVVSSVLFILTNINPINHLYDKLPCKVMLSIRDIDIFPIGRFMIVSFCNLLV